MGCIRDITGQAILLFLLALGLDVFIVSVRLPYLYPLGDEFALIAGSAQPVVNWFTEGFSGYFNVYPEYFSPYSNFLRPIVNAIYRIFYTLHLTTAVQLIVINLSVHAALSAFLYYISRRMSNTAAYSLLIYIAAWVAPAFWLSPMPIYPSFAFDALAALLCLIAVWHFANSTRASIGLFVLILAVLTKETSLPVVAAMFVVSLYFRESRLAVVIAAILLAWFAWRTVAFGNIGGVYSLQNREPFVISLLGISTLLFLPATYISILDLRALLVEHRANPALLYIVVNLFIWSACFYYLYRNRNSILKPFGSQYGETLADNRSALWVIAAMIFSAVFFVAVRGDVRLNFVFYVLFLYVLALNFKEKIGRNIALAILLPAIFIGSSKAIAGYARTDERAVFSSVKAKELVSELGNLRLQRKVYVMNDFIAAFSAQSKVTAFAGGRGEYIRGSSIDIGTCTMQEIRTIRTELSQVEAEVAVKITLPPCANFRFEGADPRRLIEHIDGNRLTRNDEIEYQFERISIRESRFTGVRSVDDFGRTMTAYIRDAGVLYFDFEKEKWRYFP